jgi:hypothetical protein
MLERYCALIFLASWFISGLLAQFYFDSVLRFQYRHFSEAWAASGRPAGFFWSPPECDRSWKTSMARSRVAWAWLVETPSWAEGNGDAARLLRRWRIASALVPLCILLSYIFFRIGC